MPAAHCVRPYQHVEASNNLSITGDRHSNRLTTMVYYGFEGRNVNMPDLLDICSSRTDLSRAKPYAPPLPHHYIAVYPDDMLSIQEWHMANKGLDTESICPRCRSDGIQPITTAAVPQSRGKPQAGRAVRFFGAKCQSVQRIVQTRTPLLP